VHECAVRSDARGVVGAGRVVGHEKSPKPTGGAVRVTKTLWALLILAFLFTGLRNLPRLRVLALERLIKTVAAISQENA